MLVQVRYGYDALEHLCNGYDCRYNNDICYLPTYLPVGRQVGEIEATHQQDQHADGGKAIDRDPAARRGVARARDADRARAHDHGLAPSIRSQRLQ